MFKLYTVYTFTDRKNVSKLLPPNIHKTYTRFTSKLFKFYCQQDTTLTILNGGGLSQSVSLKKLVQKLACHGITKALNTTSKVGL